MSSHVWKQVSKGSHECERCGMVLYGTDEPDPNYEEPVFDKVLCKTEWFGCEESAALRVHES